MPRSIDYYFAPHSPWTYLGHERLREIARQAGAAVRVLPVDLFCSSLDSLTRWASPPDRVVAG